MSNKFNIGDRVILTGKVLTPYCDWPVWGSKHSCVGTIMKIGPESIYVLWDNGATKDVVPTMLSHFTGGEENSLSPNIAFLKYKRSRNESRG